MNKFRTGQTVYSPFGVGKIICCWHGKLYDMKFIREKNGIARTETWTFEEHELIPFESGGIAANEDDAVELLNIEEVNGDLIATIKVWIQVKIDGEFYAFEKQFQEKLIKVF